MNLGAAIRNTRKKFKLSQGEFAKAIGVTQTHISQVELGFNKPSWTLLDKISKHYHIPVPIILWNGIEEEDIRMEKKGIFKILKQPIDAMIDQIM